MLLYLFFFLIVVLLRMCTYNYKYKDIQIYFPFESENIIFIWFYFCCWARNDCNLHNLLYHCLQCVYWDAAAIYLWSINHSCFFIRYPTLKDLWVLLYMQINRDSSNCFSCVVYVFSNRCVPSSNRESPWQRHSMISKWICISEMCIYVYLCIFIYLYMRINRWLYVRVCLDSIRMTTK